MTRLKALALMALMATPAQAQTASVTLAWEANTEADLAGYIVQVATRQGGPYSNSVSVMNTEAPPSAIVRDLPLGATYYFMVRAMNMVGVLSGRSNEVSITLSGLPADDCVPITGRYAVSVFPTSILRTGSGGGGSKTRFDFQLASPNSPITRIDVLMNGLAVAQPIKGEDLTAVAGAYFTMPASGAYTLTATATNAQGCARTAPYDKTVIVP